MSSSAFRSMGCDVHVAGGLPTEAVRALFDGRDRRFSRFRSDSELAQLNRDPAGAALVSDEFARMLRLALAAARATGGLITPTVGKAVVAAGYDRDFDRLPADGLPVRPERVAPLEALSLRGRLLVRAEPIELDLNGVVKGATVDDALAVAGGGWVCAGGDVATTVPIVVGLRAADAVSSPFSGKGDESVTLDRGGLATSSVARRSWRRGGELQHHLIDPATGRPAQTPWRHVTVAAGSCVAADVAAKAALLLGHAGPSWLDRRGLPGRFVGADGRVTTNETWRQAAPLRRAA